MADAPKWTSDPQSFSSTRWVYRREITTITWWPHSASRGDQTHPPVDEKHTDWYCECGTNNWPRRQHCFVCHAPRDTSDQAKSPARPKTDDADTEQAASTGDVASKEKQ